MGFNISVLMSDDHVYAFSLRLKLNSACDVVYNLNSLKAFPQYVRGDCLSYPLYNTVSSYHRKISLTIYYLGLGLIILENIDVSLVYRYIDFANDFVWAG
ncbi:hypothetical protein RchiOBHm_Chr2g0121631 [Rosa chinensis]|uniref:Uncharacterized protein n=1 Tax=Rosa chinensis TaxID=74649 RepID=A0A2P6RSP0_ROSCH|nr:hypothetical protein RchiOBHm_Chr2g0121631 [Rosa chinensis]